MVKPVTPCLYYQAFRLQEDLSFSPFVGLPVDGSDAETALIFQHYSEDFLSFMQSGPVSEPQVKRILLDMLKGIAACHSKDWVHCSKFSFMHQLHDLKKMVCMITNHGPEGNKDVRSHVQDIDKTGDIDKPHFSYLLVLRSIYLHNK